MAWLFGDKILRLGGGLLVGILVARYLGPQQFGLFNFAFSLVWLFSYFVTLGLDDIVIRELIKQPKERGILLGTSFLIKSVGGVVTFVALVLLIRYLKPNDERVFWVTAAIALSMIVRNVSIIRLWFESQVLAKYNVWAENSSFIVVSLIRVGIIYARLPMIWFAWALIFEVCISNMLYIYFYRRTGNRIQNWYFKSDTAQQLLRDSWPLILSGVAIMIYVKSDQVLLALLVGDTETGIYSVAARISEVWFFIPTAIVVSVFPSILKAREESTVLYEQKLQQLFDLMLGISLPIALMMSFLSPLAVYILFGPAYAAAAPVLAIHIWSGIFVFLGLASARYYLAENLQRNYFYQTLIGALSNILLNLILIPRYGAIGSAIATTIAYALAVFSPILFPRTRRVAQMMLATFDVRRWWRQLQRLKPM